MTEQRWTTGVSGLDGVLKTLLPGDNLVWQIDSVADYAFFAEPCCKAALASGKRVVYFRFAKHPPLLEQDAGADWVMLQPEKGFEVFIRTIHQTINQTRDQGVYLFDCLSDLIADWYSDRMLGNFFRLICPYVYDVQGLAYFAMLRNHHALTCCVTITDTTQILIDVYRHRDKLYIHPVKVQHRHSPTMYLLHVWDRDRFSPVTNSSTIAEIMTSHPLSGLQAGRSRLGAWDRAFLESAEHLHNSTAEARVHHKEESEFKYRLLRMLVSRDERMLRLCQNYFDLEDILNIWQRMVGTGLIGGKAVGMLLARAILCKSHPRWKTVLEAHDSFYIGSDVFYTYLVQNGCWWVREKQKNPKTFLEGAEEGRRRIHTGSFTPEIESDFADMLDYFGQCPIIVRSSSLLEDAFGNSFAGKYESVFCVNQGSRNKRLEDFISAVKTIYASTMSEKALHYRAHRELLNSDEQMSLLVQRVSGSLYSHLFYPQVAGVAFSFNPYVWSEKIDPEAGMARIVFGLGTRAVDRRDDDYTRVVALNAPSVRPESGIDQVRRYAQRKVDVLDQAANQLVSQDFVDVTTESTALPVELFASRDREAESFLARSSGHETKTWMLTFQDLLSETSFVEDLRNMLRTLQDAYQCPVDTEFTLNFFNGSDYKINLVQCRPLHIAQEEATLAELPSVQEQDVVFKAHGAVVGYSRSNAIHRIIYVAPEAYGKLAVGDRYAIARLIGRLMNLDLHPRAERVMLLGPGRWGTTTPSLGVPVSYAEIKNAAVLCEVVAMHEGLVPDVSLGTHFFNELVEADILYLAIFPGRDNNFLNTSFLDSMPNRLATLLPEAAHRSDVVHVVDARDLPQGGSIMLHAHNRGQKALCYRHGALLDAEQ